MKRKSSLIILVVVLVALAGVYAFLSNRPQKDDTPEAKPSIEISKLDRDKIKKAAEQQGKGIDL